MKTLSPGKTITFVLAALFVLGAAVTVTVWVRLNRYINEPGFCDTLAKELSDSLGGEVRLGRAYGRLGWRSWVTLEGFSFNGQKGLVRLSAANAHISVKLAPLLFGRITLSSVDVDAPSLSLRRSKGGDWPLVGKSLRSREKKENEGLTVRFNNVDLKNATVLIVDETISGKSLVTLQGGLKLNQRENTVFLDFSSRVKSLGRPGQISIKGTLHPTVDLRMDAGHIPLGIVHPFVPAANLYNGALDFNLRLWQTDGRISWESQGTLMDPFLIATSSALPFSFQWDAKEEGNSQVTAHWLTADTDLTALMTLKDISSPDITLSVTGPRLSLTSVSDLREIFSEGKKSTAPWTATISLNIDEIAAGPVLVREVKGKALLKPDRGDISRLEAHVPGGLAVISGRWRNTSRGTRFSANVDAEKLDMTDMAEALGSSVPASGFLNLTARCVDVPLPVLPAHPAQILESLMHAREVQGRVTTGSCKMDRADIDDLEMDFSQSKGKARANLILNGAGGRISGDYEGHFQKGGGVIHQATMSIRGLDLSMIPHLVDGWGIRSGVVNATTSWRWTDNGGASSLVWSPGASWSADVILLGANWRGVSSGQLQARIAWNGDGVLHLEEMKGTLSKGTLLASGGWTPSIEPSSSTYQMSLQWSEMEVGPLLLAISTRPVLLQGIVTGNLSLSGGLWSGQDDRVNGRLFLVGRDGLFAQSPAGLKIFSDLKLGSLYKKVSGQRVPGLPFNVIEASAPIREGRMFFDQPAVFKNSDIELAYTGWVDMDFLKGEGSLIVNGLTGTRDLLQKVPGVSQILMGPNWEFLPIVVDISFVVGNVKTNIRSIQSLTGPVTGVIKNIFKLPGRIFGLDKK